MGFHQPAKPSAIPTRRQVVPRRPSIHASIESPGTFKYEGLNVQAFSRFFSES